MFRATKISIQLFCNTIVSAYAAPNKGITILTNFVIHVLRAVEIPCLTCPTWSHFIQDKLKIVIYLSLDKYKCIKLIKFCISYFD